MARLVSRFSLRMCSAAESRKPPRHPRPRRNAVGRPGAPREPKWKRWTCGFTCDTIGCVTLNIELRLSKGMSTRRLPSRNWLPQLQGIIEPSGSFCRRHTGFKIPGTAADASTADQTMQSGAVTWFISCAGECCSNGTTLMLRVLPVRSNASRNVNDPRVKNCTFRAHFDVSKRAPVRHARAIQTCIGSSQPVMCRAKSGTSSSFNSSFVRVHKRAAMSPPAEVPLTMLGSRFASNRARATPMW